MRPSSIKEGLKSQGLIRVLHVDDEIDQLRFSKLFLERADSALQILSSLSPREAQQILQEQDFDCIVSNYQMPEMDGIEFARKVKETTRIPFILYTGRGSEEVAEAAFAAGIDDYMRKELELSHYQVLARRIRQAVEGHRAEVLRKRVIASIRHDLSSPLQTIKNSTCLLRQKPEKVEELLEKIDDAVDSAVRILDELRQLVFCVQ